MKVNYSIFQGMTKASVCPKMFQCGTMEVVG